MAGEEAGFKAALAKIGEKLRDVSELNVRTYTGDISAAVANVQGVDGKPPTAKQVMDQVFQNGDLEVVGLTSMMIDGDIDEFISNVDTHKDLVAVHTGSVKTGQATRSAAFELFKSAIGDLIKK